jgi:hypothetical protein
MSRLARRITENLDNFEKGIYNYIPYSFEGLHNYFPGIFRGDYTLLTAGTSAGKTTLAKKMHIFDAIKFARKNKIKLHILAFLLEETETQFDYSLLSYLSNEKYGLRYNFRHYEAFGKTIKREDIPLLEECEKGVDVYKKYCTLHTHTFNTFGIYKTIREFARNRGKFFYKGREVPRAELEKPGDTSWDMYRADDPDEFVIVFFDNFNILHPQKNQAGLREAMIDMSRDFKDLVTKAFNYYVIGVVQQAFEKEDLEHVRDWEMFASLQGVGNSKEITRDAVNVLGLTSLSKFTDRQATWKGYPIRTLGNYFRVIDILKSRFGEVNVKTSLFFDGMTANTWELPKDDKEALAKALKLVKEYDTK